MKLKEMVFDIEADDLLPKVSTMHVVSWQEVGSNSVKSGFTHESFNEVFDTDLLIGHFIIGYDLPALKKLFGIEPDKKVIIVDTLALAWYLDIGRLKYGLESYGEDFKTPKPKIHDWQNLSIAEYTNRCERDVSINERLWRKLRNKLGALYGYDEHGNLSPQALKLIKYLSFKLQCAFNTEQEGIRLDYKRTKTLLDDLTEQREVKVKQLSEAMPKHALTKRVVKPQNLYKKDETLSDAGKRWFEHLKVAGLPVTTQGPINVIYDYEPGNPGSNTQIKDWLWSLGWKPSTFKFSRDKDGKEKFVPQVRDGGELCDSVKELISKDPAIEHLDGLTVLNHRISILESFIKNAEYIDGEYWIRSTIEGLTNTFRFKHRAPLVNLPGVDKPYGADIRGCLLAPSDDHVLMGSDMVSLEDTTKRHYMKPYDPEYVEEMSREGYDPHLDLAKYNNAVTQEQIDQYNAGDDLVVKALKPIRKSYKVTNYSATYGIGKAALARDLDTTEKAAKELLDAFWGRNWSIKEIAKNSVTKELIDGSLWVLNPVSGFWMSLRNTKDIFSTLNQSTGVFVFDTWLYHLVQKDIKIIMQYHDEFLSYVPKNSIDISRKLVQDATEEMNESLKLNVYVGSDIQFGKNYAECH